jgi:glucan phosphoethanolaminetransferase (alkaline phosphatase superfamily)
MKTLSRIAKPCGIAGGVWGVLLAIIYSLFLPTHTVITTTNTGQSSIITITSSESWDWVILAFIILTALMGILGLLAVILRMRNPGLGQLFIWISALAMLVLSLGNAITMVRVGIILLPTAILLILAAIGMGKKEEAVPVEAT